MAGKRDYYEVLGVLKTASVDEISGAYRRLAIKFHPDKNPGDDQAIASFKEAAEAFEVLSDVDKRARYDRYGHAGVDAMRGGAPHFTDVEDIFAAFGDVFGDIFGRGGRGRRRVHRGEDIRTNVTLSLLEAARGVKKTIRFQRHEKCADCSGSGAQPGTEKTPCGYCGGHGQVIQSSGFFRVQTTCPSCHGEGTIIKDPCTICKGSGFMPKRVSTEVQIPAGVDTGMQVRIAGHGQPSPNGGPSGDCYCVINVQKHPLFDREGRDLICRVPITYSQAALGTTIEVPTLDSPHALALPPGTQSGQVFRIRGRGLADPRRRGVGDLVVQVNIDVPDKLSQPEEELLRKLAELEHAHVAPRRQSFFEKLKKHFAAEGKPGQPEE